MTTALRMRLTGEDEKRMSKTYTANPEAYQGYLKGRYWWNKRTEEGLGRASNTFSRPLQRIPLTRWPIPAWPIATVYSQSTILFLPKEAYPKAKEAALKALEIDDTLAEAHTSLGMIKTNYDWDWSGAEREYQRAIELNPKYATAHQW